MKQYAGDYQKYMSQGQSGGSAGAQSGNYEQYMNQGGSGNSSSMQSGDYEKYINQYAGDYQKYITQYSGNQSQNENMTQDEAVQAYASGYVPEVRNTSDETEW